MLIRRTTADWDSPIPARSPAPAAHAAPPILLAEARQADRDETRTETEARHRADADARLSALMQYGVDQPDLTARLAEDNRRQTARIAELLEQSSRVLKRESEQTDLLVAALVQEGKRTPMSRDPVPEAAVGRLDSLRLPTADTESAVIPAMSRHYGRRGDAC
jgi:hypothetical protein